MTGVVPDRRWMCGDNDFHARTLPQVSNRLHLDGDWPGAVTIRRGWAKATARPWNDDGPAIALRLERGSADFLRSVAEHMTTLDEAEVYSPALHPDGTQVWKRAGFRPVSTLDVMERTVGGTLAQPVHQVEVARRPDWESLVAVDASAFEGFWRMSRLGLIEAMEATPRSAVLQTSWEGKVAGYALVGAQLSISFLQRVAVTPEFAGRGLGTSLVRQALRWSASRGVRSMVLNVRKENVRARSLYESEGFSRAAGNLVLMRFDGGGAS